MTMDLIRVVPHWKEAQIDGLRQRNVVLWDGGRVGKSSVVTAVIRLRAMAETQMEGVAGAAVDADVGMAEEMAGAAGMAGGLARSGEAGMADAVDVVLESGGRRRWIARARSRTRSLRTRHLRPGRTRTTTRSTMCWMCVR